MSLTASRQQELDTDHDHVGGHTPSSRDVVQLRAMRSVMRRGTALPGGARVKSTEGDPDSVFSTLASLSSQCWRGAVPNWAETDAGARVNAALGRGNFSADMIQINHKETNGINMNWTGTITLRIENPEQFDGGTAEVTAGAGGSSTNTTGTKVTETDSASLTVGANAGGTAGSASGDKTKGGETSSGGSAGANASGTVGTTTATERTNQAADTAQSTVASKSIDKVKVFKAKIIANITLRCEPDFSGSDYINPFKWGLAGASAASGPSTAQGSADAGTVTYEMSAGLASPGTPGPGVVPPPAAK